MLELAYLIVYSLVFFTGISIGSFLNVVIYRVPQKISVAQGRSFCPECNTIIKTYDLIPVLSYFILRGKCRKCSCEISPRYPRIENLTGVLYLLIFIVHGLTLDTLVYFAFTAILVAITFIDFDTMTIPDSLNIAILVVAVVAFFALGETNYLSKILGALVASLPMFVITVCVPGAFGGGDIKMMAAAGLLLGLSNTVVATFVAVLIGGGYAVYLMKTKDVNKETHMAFGPCLCMGCYIACLCGPELANWYIGLL